MEKRQLDLSNYRLEKAGDDLGTAEENLKNNRFSQSTNRSYFSMFHAVRALLALDEFELEIKAGRKAGLDSLYQLVVEYVGEREGDIDVSRLERDGQIGDVGLLAAPAGKKQHGEQSRQQRPHGEKL